MLETSSATIFSAFLSSANETIFFSSGFELIDSSLETLDSLYQ